MHNWHMCGGEGAPPRHGWDDTHEEQSFFPFLGFLGVDGLYDHMPVMHAPLPCVPYGPAVWLPHPGICSPYASYACTPLHVCPMGLRP